MRVCDYLAKFVYDRLGVKDVFILSGGGIMHLEDGVACHKKLRALALHHEQSISMAIEAYARTNEHFAVGFFTTGPGTTNAVTGLAGAWLDSVPCLFISGQAKRKETVYKARIKGLRQFGVQELNILPIVRSITKYAAMVDRPEDIRYHLEKAYALANSGRPGPAWLDIPLDVQGAIINERALRRYTHKIAAPKIPAAKIKTVCNLLKKSSRPVIIAGRGIRAAKSVDMFKKFITHTKIPVVATYLGVDALESTHPQSIGRIGVKGDRPGNLAVQNADLLIVMGSSMPVANTGFEYKLFAREAKVIVVDIEPASFKKKTITVNHLIKGDITDFLKQMLKRKWTANKNHLKWANTARGWKKEYPACLPEYARRKKLINIYYFIDRLSKKLKRNDVIVTDAGSAFYVGSQGTCAGRGVRYITSGGLSSMGYSLPASIGASFALGGKRVMCVTGDGSFQQTLQEMQAIVHYKLPVKIFVLNNKGYLSIRFTQGRYFNNRFVAGGSDKSISFPDLKKLAGAYAIKYARLRNNADLKNLSRIINSSGPVLCEVLCPSDQLIIPTVASQKRPDGTMVSKPLEDMFPFLDRDELKRHLFIKPVD